MDDEIDFAGRHLKKITKKDHRISADSGHEREDRDSNHSRSGSDEVDEYNWGKSDEREDPSQKSVRLIYTKTDKDTNRGDMVTNEYDVDGTLSSRQIDAARLIAVNPDRPKQEVAKSLGLSRRTIFQSRFPHLNLLEIAALERRVMEIAESDPDSRRKTTIQAVKKVEVMLGRLKRNGLGMVGYQPDGRLVE